jgi:hypothetical protein
MPKISKDKERKNPGKLPTTQLLYLNQEINKHMSSRYMPEVKDKAMALYLLGHDVSAISQRMGLEPRVISDWADKGKWVAKRADLFKKAYQQSWGQIGNNAAIAQNLAQALFNDQIQKKMAANEELSWDELKKLSDMIVSMQKVSRTEDGKPTEITQTLTIREQRAQIRMILKEDPFQEFADVIEHASMKQLGHKDVGHEISTAGAGTEDSKAECEVEPSSGTAESRESDF